MTEPSVAGCPLCDSPQAVIAQSAHWMLILNENQATLGRVYFSVRRHETDITRLTPDELTDLWAGLSEAKAALDTLFEPDHINFVFHMNLVAHVHGHLYPRYKTAREFAGNTFDDRLYGRHYDPAEERVLDADVSLALIREVRSALQHARVSALQHASMLENIY